MPWRSDEAENLVDLYAHEHFIAHKLLSDENPDDDRLTQAYFAMASVRTPHEERYDLSPEEYEEARIRFSNALKRRYKDKTKHPSYGKPISEERKQIISKANKGNRYCVGRVVSEETRQKISQANKNPSDETRQKMSEAQLRRGLSYGNNPRAKRVMRNSDGKVYGSIKEAAEDNNMVYTTFKALLGAGKVDFSYV